MIKVIKRDGKVVDFQIEKINQAIEKAFQAEHIMYTPGILNLLALKVTSELQPKIKDGLVNVEDIQDCVECTLMEAGYNDVAKSYILYRKRREKVRNIKATILDYRDVIEGYTKIEDWRVKENSTVTYSIGGLILNNSGAVTANYWLSEIYDKEIADAHRNADIHIHDLSMLTGYCAGWSLKQLIQEGLGGIQGKITSAPAKHLSVLCNQMVNFLGILQNEWAGAQAFSSFDTYLAPFAKVDNLTYLEIKKCIESFIYGVNIPSRWGTQAPFSNITLDWTVPDDLAELPAIVGGKEMDFKYKDCKPEMDLINKAFIEIMIEGDANGRGFQYPIPTYSITKDFDWSETENNKLLFEMTAKYGTPYFSNYINSDMQPSDIRSMCPLHPLEPVLTKEPGYDWQVMSIGCLYNAHNDNIYKVLLNGKEHFARINKFENLKFKRITLTNGHSIIVSDNHLNLILRTEHGGCQILDEPTENIKTTDYLPFNQTAIKSANGGLNQIHGKMIGLFLIHGEPQQSYENRIAYNFDIETDEEIIKYVIEQSKTTYGAKLSVYNTNQEGTKIRLILESGILAGLIDQYIEKLRSYDENTQSMETQCLLKPCVIDKSISFRSGIVDALRKDKQYIDIKSKFTRDTICLLLASMGLVTDITKTIKQIDGSTEVDYYRIRIVQYNKTNDSNNIKNRIVRKNYVWYKIKSIEDYEDNTGIGYCMEVIDNNEEPYFMLPNGLITHNCRLRLNLRELRKKNGGFFGSGESTGSIGVVTINMPRLAYLAESEEDFYDRLNKIMDLSARSLHTKRETINNLFNNGLYPYTKRYLENFENHFSTIGLVGMNEAGLNARWLQADMTDPKTQEFTKNVLNHMRNRLADYQEQYPGELYNLEATPAESTSYRLAKHDREKYPDILTAGEPDDIPYYTNSSHLPVDYTSDIFDALDIQDELQTLYTSGTVFHGFLGEKLPSWKSAQQLVRKIAENYKLPYYTLSPTYSVCKNHGYIAGEHFTCPTCGEPAEVYSRITGYYRPVQNWNDGKTQEYKNRQVYNLKSKTTPPSNIPPSMNSTSKPVLTNISNNIKPDKPMDWDKPILITTNTCPNCKAAKQMLKNKNIDITIINAEEHPEIAKQYNVQSVPVLIINDNKYTGIGEIKALLN